MVIVAERIGASSSCDRSETREIRWMDSQFIYKMLLDSTETKLQSKYILTCSLKMSWL